MDNKILQIISQKRDLMANILTLTKEQPVLIDAETMDGLLDNIARRQKLIDKIDLLDKELETADFKEAEPGSETARILGGIHSILQEIVAQDKKNEEQATLRMSELRAQLKNLQEGHKRSSAYMNEGDVPAVYFDKQK